MDAPVVPAEQSSHTLSEPRPRLKLKQRLAQACLSLAGWRIEGERPTPEKYIVIAAPHTSNWDFVYMKLIAAVLDVKLSFMGKHTLFRPPLGWLLSAMGGVPVDRRASQDLVQQMAQAFRERDSFHLAVPPEGTRHLAPHWKSGFYVIAREAGVPICLGFLDYSRKVGGLGPLITPSGDLKADMDIIRAFYAGKKGRYPDQVGPIFLTGEEKRG